MRKCYTRPCNFYYGSYARKLIAKKIALTLAGNPNIAFDQIEIIKRKEKRIITSDYCSISKIKGLSKSLLPTIKHDIKKITSKRKNILGLNFNKPKIMGVLNITPDSFSDGGLFFDETKAYDQANLMIINGASIIDVGGESTRPGSNIVNEKEEWKRIKNTIVKFKKEFPKIILSLDTNLRMEVMSCKSLYQH